MTDETWPRADGVRISPTGQIHLRVDDVDHFFRRADYGTMLAFRDRAAALQARATGLDGAADTAPAESAAQALVTDVFTWWRDLTAVLLPDVGPFPADDNLMPGWLAGVRPMVAVCNAWGRLAWIVGD